MPKHASWREAHEERNADLMERFPEGQDVVHPEFGDGVVAGYSSHPRFDEDGNCVADPRSVVVDFDPHGREFIREGDELNKLKAI